MQNKLKYNARTTSLNIYVTLGMLENNRYIKIENFRTIKLSDKILSESLFVRNVMKSESSKFIENGKAQRNVT